MKKEVLSVASEQRLPIFNSNTMNTPDPALLRKAIKITMEIEQLDEELHRLLLEARSKTTSSLLQQEPSVKDMTQAAQARLSKKGNKKTASKNTLHDPEVTVAEVPSLSPLESTPVEEVAIFPHISEQTEEAECLVSGASEMSVSLDPEVAHQEQQALLMEDSGQEPLALIEIESNSESAPSFMETTSEAKEDHASSFFF